MSNTYLETNEASVIKLLRQNPRGPVVMLNLLRFRAIADYSQYPALAPDREISGHRAYQHYPQSLSQS